MDSGLKGEGDKGARDGEKFYGTSSSQLLSPGEGGLTVQSLFWGIFCCTNGNSPAQPVCPSTPA